ncbi:MAG: nuclear transport factor 2 family protein [Novosphingobium sp.]
MHDFVATECAIRQLHARYADAVWRKDSACFGALFADDAEWRVGGQVMRGREKITAFIEGAFPLYRRIMMTFRTPIVDLAADGTASARTYVTENSLFADGTPFAPIGIYFDRFAQIDGRWLFTWRMFQTHYIGEPDLKGEWYDMPEYGPPPGMPPRDEETFDRSGTGAKAVGK